MSGFFSFLNSGAKDQELQELHAQLAECHDKLGAIDKAQATIEFEPTGIITDANQNFLDAMGYQLSEIVGKHHKMFVDPTEATSADYQRFWSRLQNGESFSAEFKRIDKRGEDVWIQASYNPLRDSNGSVYKVVKYANDITERKIFATESRAKLNAISRSMAAIEFNLDGTIITANENFLATLGYTLNEITGKHHRMFASQEHAASHEYTEFWKTLASGEFVSGEFERIAKDGSSVWIQASYNPILDAEGKPYKVVKFASDITQQKETATQNTAIMDAIGKSQAVIEFEPDGTIIQANENFLNALGYRLDEIRGQHHSIFVDKDYSKSNAYQDFWSRLGQGVFDQGEYERFTKTGESIWIQATYNPLFDASGNVTKVIKFATDITAEKQQAASNKKNADISSALKLCSANIMLVDMNQEITYVNDELLSLFGHRQTELRRTLTGFSTDTVIGSNIRTMVKDVSISKMFGVILRESHEKRMEIGDLTFHLVVSPWLSADGDCIGSVVEWKDLTDELAIEREIDQVVSAVASGDVTQQIPLDRKEGFYLNLAKGLNSITATIEVAFNDIIRVLGAMARGDLSERVTRDYQGAFGRLKDDANTTAEKLTDIIAGIRSSSSAIKTAASEIAQGNSDLSQRTESQASSLEETASSMEEMTATVKQSSDNAQEANRKAAEAQSVAKKGGDVVKHAVLAMNDINESSKKISDIIGVIDEIAFQTNLLALNAAVEAARAGEQGRGFAVVAGEVRNLAQRSAGAAKEIKGLIQDSVNKIDDGAKLVNQSGETLAQIVASVENVTQMMGEIAASSEEQTAGIGQVNSAISQMDETTQQNAALVEEATAAATSMSDQANELMNIVGFFGASDGGDTAASPAITHTHVNAPATAAETRAPVAPQISAAKPTPTTSEMPAEDEWEDF
jgi:methyl-accepting chemotaxis protein